MTEPESPVESESDPIEDFLELLPGSLGEDKAITNALYRLIDQERANASADMREETAELRALFSLRYDADMRAIKMWQDAHPGKELIWPDHADLVVWLLEQQLQGVVADDGFDATPLSEWNY